MPFQESAQSWRSKAHASEIKPAVAVSLCVIVLLLLFFVALNIWDMVQADSFEIKAQQNEQNFTESNASSSDDEATFAQGAKDDEKGANNSASITQNLEIVIHVSGAVEAPGVYRLKEGARVEEAVSAAGGFKEGAAYDAINLARILTDGEQIMIPSAEEVEAGLIPHQNEGSAHNNNGGNQAQGLKKININTASAEELISLSGIGMATAQKIIKERELFGPFSSPEDIMRVSGIGEKKFAQIVDSICV